MVEESDNKSTMIYCPCDKYKSIESICTVLEDDVQTKILIEWLRGIYNQRAFDSRDASGSHLSCGGKVCKKRGHVSLMILNSIRDACRPFVETSTVGTISPISTSKSNNGSTKPRFGASSAVKYDKAFPPLKTTSTRTNGQQEPQNNVKVYKKNPSMEEEFPSLLSSIRSTTTKSSTNHTLVEDRKKNQASNGPELSKSNKSASAKPKKRIRPVPVAAEPNAHWGKGNLEGIPSDESPLNAPPPGFGPTLKPITSSVPGGKEDSVLKTSEEGNISSTLKERFSDASWNEPESSLKTPTKQVRKESTRELLEVLPICHLVDVYLSLINSCMVPSSALELQLLFRLLNITTTVEHTIAERSINHAIPSTLNESGLASILRNPERCVFFAIRSLEQLVGFLQGFGIPFLRDLIRCPPFHDLLPGVTEKITSLIQERIVASENNISINLDQTTALLTLPFKEDRDSRHNYRTNEEQAIYKNREVSRDAFLYQLRAFLNVRGKLVNAEQSNKEIQKIRQSSCAVVKGLIDANISWFAELFCDLLLQIGLVPIQETDKDLLNIADQDKLQKLHKRFFSHSDNSTRTILSNPDRSVDGSSPVTSAQKFFPGHQEFFFMFIISADSYAFGLNLRSRFIYKINDRMNTVSRSKDCEKQLMELCMIARFLGVLTFSPNWSTSRVPQSEPDKSKALDGIYQLSLSGLSVLDLAKEALVTSKVVVTIPWVVELLKMSSWDRLIKYSRPYYEVLTYLRQLQVEVFKEPLSLSFQETNRQVVVQSLESLFEETVGFAQAVSLSMTKISVPELTKVDYDELRLDEVEIQTTSGILFGMNPHIQELVALVSKLTRQNYETLRTPGASRKLRPSIVSPPTATFATLKNESEGMVFPETPESQPKGLGKPAVIATNGLGSFQSKLKERFFHQHFELKTLCEFAVSRALKTTKESLLGECIRPFFESNYTEEHGHQFTIRAKDACKAFVEASLRNQVQDALMHLAPPGLDSKVIDMSISLAVTHSMHTHAPMIEALIEGEIKRYHSIDGSGGKKNLFADNSAYDHSKLTNSTNADEVMQIATTAMMNILDNMESLKRDTTSFVSLVQVLSVSANNVKEHSVSEIPSESTLRSYFTSILRVDDWSQKILEFAIIESMDFFIAWELLQAFIQTAIKLAETSHYGLPNVGLYFSSLDNILQFLQFTSQTPDIMIVAELVIAMMQARILEFTCLKDALEQVNAEYKEYSKRLRRILELKAF